MRKISSVQALLKRVENRKVVADLRGTVLQHELEATEARRWKMEAQLAHCLISCQ